MLHWLDLLLYAFYVCASDCLSVKVYVCIPVCCLPVCILAYHISIVFCIVADVSMQQVFKSKSLAVERLIQVDKSVCTFT